jgi:hypothetical protein
MRSAPVALSKPHASLAASRSSSATPLADCPNPESVPRKARAFRLLVDANRPPGASRENLFKKADCRFPHTYIRPADEPIHHW